MFSKRSLRVAVSILVLTSVASAAADDAKKKEEKKLPPSGSLSVSRSTGAVTSNIPGVWGEEDAGGKEGPPIAGSVSRLNGSTWRMRVFNNTEDTYSVNLGVVQRDGRGTAVKTDSYSYTLRPKDSKERDIPSGVGAMGAELELRSFKNLSAKNRPKAPDSDAEAGSGDTKTE